MILCGGSANDLMEQGLEIGRYFHVIDSFDTHAKIEEHFTGMDRVAKAAGKVALISMGWDPGLFSLMRLLGEAALPHGKNYTFWGRGISQGHSNAIRRIAGVADAKQYTVPKEEYLERARNGEMSDFTAQESHLRECYVVLEDGADQARVENEIRHLKNYFEGYETEIRRLRSARRRNTAAGSASHGIQPAPGEQSELHLQRHRRLHARADAHGRGRQNRLHHHLRCAAGLPARENSGRNSPPSVIRKQKREPLGSLFYCVYFSASFRSPSSCAWRAASR